MRKSKIADLDRETLERLISMAQEERKPFEVIKEEFGISENEVTELLRKRLSKDQFDNEPVNANLGYFPALA